VYKAIKAEAEAAAELAIAILRGEDASSMVTGSVNNGTNDIPSVLLVPVSVTADNIAETVIADGFRTWDEICVGDYAQYCPDADAEMEEEMAEEEGMMMETMVPTTACEVDLTGEEIVLYQQAGREGPLAAILGQGFAYATEDAINMINDEGGVCGATLSVVFGETNYDVEQEIAVYEQFRASDPKPVILYSYGSGATVALKDRVIEDQIVHFVAGLNSEAIYIPRGGYTYGAAPIYSDQFAGWMTWLNDNWADIKPASAGDEIVIGVIGWPNAFGAGATTPEAIAYAESLGITVLPLEEQALSPDADVSGQVQNMLISGANAIYNQSLSFSPAQVVGTIHALGFWEDVIVGGVNWSMHNDVPIFLGDNPQLMDGYCGMFPYAYWSDTDIIGVQAAMSAFEAAGRDEADRSTTYLTTFGQFLATREILINTVNAIGSADITGEDVLDTMIDLGTISGGDISVYEIDEERRAPSESQVRCIRWDGEQLNWEVAQDFFELPDTRPPAP
ncbi:MAG: ABC transporter substrate-binding protein, partial [Anaerolineales bacterium]|nr:ABC transporter substrate-binding protein [Anaerolineales bacterium]